jgi:hypothetical protein
MRIINYKSPESKDFQRYVDIGWCESQIESYCIYSKNSTLNYIDWLNEFNKISLGEQMLSLNFYWRQFHEDEDLTLVVRTDDYFIEVYGEKIHKIFSENYNLFFEFKEKWFFNHLLFDGLDLEGKKEDIDYSVDNDDGIMLEVFFNDGSAIRFLDDNDHICSLYVAEEDFLDLKNEIERIISKFQPYLAHTLRFME